MSLNLRCTRLKHEGLEVTTSDNGHDGLLRFRQTPSELVVLDLNDDCSENALIAGQLKKEKPGTAVVMLIKDRVHLAPGAVDLADWIILKSEEQQVLPGLLRQLLKVA